MAGHNKWSQIKHKKAAADGKRSALFGKLSKRITVESKNSGGALSVSLRAAIEAAKKADMPKENIERAIEKGKSTGGEQYEEIMYEMYGPGGSALLIIAVTDSRNRTGQELKHLVQDAGFSLATPGSAQWAFSKTGAGTWAPHTTVPLSPEDQKELEALVLALLSYDDIEAVFSNEEKAI